jgi:hypothetical protein
MRKSNQTDSINVKPAHSLGKRTNAAFGLMRRPCRLRRHRPAGAQHGHLRAKARAGSRRVCALATASGVNRWRFRYIAAGAWPAQPVPKARQGNIMRGYAICRSFAGRQARGAEPRFWRGFATRGMLRNRHYVAAPPVRLRAGGASWWHATLTRARGKPLDAATAKDGPASAGQLGRMPGGPRRGGWKSGSIVRICQTKTKAPPDPWRPGHQIPCGFEGSGRFGKLTASP